MRTGDPFGTAGLRAAVLDAWRASPARFREDANSEEDLVVGGYRDRLLVELAQNAADATRLSGVPGRLRVELTISPSPQLVVSNTGVPLDRAGVIGLSTLRASGKRHGDTIGRFGVGFAAVLAVSDSPEVRSRHGGVRFSLAESAELARSLPELAPELERRSFRPPVLRLPFPSDAAPEAGFDTTVVLPLRDAHAVDEVIAAIHQVDEALLLVLEPLAELALVTPSDDGFDERRFSVTRHDDSAVIVTATQTTTGESTQASTSWLLERRSGSLPPELAATLPTEARAQDRWDVLWALPDRAADDDGGRRSFAVHAPTETDEPLTLPALLVASLPLQPDRRHVLPGPVTDRVIEEAASAYAALAVRVGDPLLVPMGFPAGALDSRLHELVRDLLRGARILGGRRPPEAVWVPALGEGVLEQLRPQLPELVGPPWSRAPRALRALEVPERGIADVVDALASVRADPEWWGHLYSLLDADGVSRDDLGALPVPLLDGRLVRGARGVLLPSQSLPSGADPELLAELSLRVAHPAAVAPAGAGRLLARLGAVETDASALLHDPAVAAALSRADDEGDEAELLRLARFVLALLAASPALTEQPGLALAELPWLADLELPAADGELRFADELALPDSPLLRLAPDDLAAVDLNTLDLDTLDLNTLDLDTIRRDASREALVAAGVRDTFPVVLVRELPVEADESELAASVAALDDVAGWLDFLAAAYPGATVVQARALADLDLVADEDWPLAFELLGTRRETLDAVLAPAELQLPDGAHATAASYATWWLSQHALLAGRAPSRWSTGEDALLAELLPTVPVTLDPALQRALGVRTTLSALLSEPGGPEAVLDLLAEVEVSSRVLSMVLARLAQWATTVGELSPLLPEPPDVLRAAVGDVTAVVPAEDVVVLDRPDLLPVLMGERAPHLRVPPELAGPLAALLDLDVASEHWPEREAPEDGQTAPEDGQTVRPGPAATALTSGRRVAVPGWTVLTSLLPGGAPSLPTHWWEHDELRWHGVDVEWRVVEGQVHATTLAGLARGLAWSAGRWDQRFALLELLLNEESAPAVLAEADLDASPLG